MAERITLLKAILRHLMLPDESLSTFRAQFAKLTPQDKDDLKAQFTREFGYEIIEPQG